MKKIFKIICFSAIVFCLLAISSVAAGSCLMPDSFRTLEGSSPDTGIIFKIAADSQPVGSTEEKCECELRLLGVLPVKNVSVTVEKRPKVVVCGSVFALRMSMQGICVVDIDSVITAEGEKRPALDAGFMKGDVITAVNGALPDGAEEIGSIISGSGGNAVTFTVTRADTSLLLTLTPAQEESTGIYKAGLWLRDSAAGIGTMTFYDQSSGVFAGLGHCVSDADTGMPVLLSKGEAFSATITGIRKGGNGKAGELTGAFVSADLIGDIRLNSDRGVYGFLSDTPADVGEYELAEPAEIETGPAQIVASIDNEGPKFYAVDIKKILNGEDNRNLVVRVTDTRLLAASGGIVQGMSGSPIIQNGRLIGAVTHVLLDDSATGYAIFAKTMYNAALTVAQQQTKNAA
ncbi:MAG: SpoIVB peptidase [Clostridia bacterium]|nr:SpoIVB peptidase [Clostridia bacterium]